MFDLTTIEMCAGAGGQALGLEQAGYEHLALIEIDRNCCNTLRLNRPAWNVIEYDLNRFSGNGYRGIDLLAGGLPCPPFSIAGKKLGENDERNLFPAAIRIIDEIRPKAIMIENVKGLISSTFAEYRNFIEESLRGMNYTTGWKLLNACDFGVPQLRPRVAFVAIANEFAENFVWPRHKAVKLKTIGETLFDLMSVNGWKKAEQWLNMANDIAPTIVGGSHKHGGPDLGPTRAKTAWAKLGVDAHGLADSAPAPDFQGMPRLTVRMVARLQGFPDDWVFSGKKTAAYKQVGNAFPPPVARAISGQIRKCLSISHQVQIAK